ncbi:MAG: glycogen-binding domain-containing protein [Gemmatimonadales bacterium]
MKLTSFPIWVGCLVLGASAPPLLAQAAFTLDGTGTRVAYSDSPGTTAWALTPSFQLTQPWRSLGASGTYAQFPDGAWSLRGQAAGSTFSPSVLGFRAEVAGSMSGTLYYDQSRSGQYAGTLRLHWLGTGAGAWVGGSAGNAWNGVGWLTATRAEVGAWIRRGVASLTVTVSPTSIGENIRYADYESALQVNSGPLELVASGGLRQWSGSSAGSTPTWGMGSAAYWLGGHVAVVASAGTYPADYAQGLPHGTYASLGFRFATRRPDVVTPRLRARLLAAGGGRGSPALEARRHSANTVTLTLTAISATTVEIMGDFTQWSPVALIRVRPDRWAVTLPISSGSHRMNVRIDGGAWGVPRGTPSVSDEFSGIVGLLVIE